LSLLLFSCVFAWTGLRAAPLPQSSGDPYQIQESRHGGPPPQTGGRPDPNDQMVKMQKEMERKNNHERQTKLQGDTDKLFKLATELKDQVDQSNEGILSLDVVKKAEEIEKLAHSVKEKMKGN